MKLLGHVEVQALCVTFCFELRLQTMNLDEWECGIEVQIKEIVIYFLDHLTLL